ncbi:MAG: DUF3644 domain-containing protein [Sarcina ventriculi]|nr:DUF3644 domain-containing protein [Sarcina ventriculi]MDY7062494.1 DUF3644 domain-containing protein [Sarcina ventriculi]
MNNIKDKLLNKSKEAFMLAIEIYNKPTIMYRVEGFSFFICNAWELMLKAHIINKFGEQKIYYSDSPNRTISLEKCISNIFTNDKAPLRLNLEKIIELRNTSTHFITEEYEMIYIPLFQSCIFNFIEKMQEFHEIDMTEIIPQNFITLAVSMKSLNESEIRAKYSNEIANKMINTYSSISKIVEQNNSAFAIRIDHYHYITKDKSKATSIVHIDSKAEAGVQIIKELKDPNDTHKYTAKNCNQEIRRRLNKLNISNIRFNQYHFNLFCKYYDIKRNTKLCYVYKVGTQPKYSYSVQTIDFIVGEIKKNPESIIQDLKEKLQKQKK